LLEQAKREAARCGETLTALIEQGLRFAQIRYASRRLRLTFPVSRAGGWSLPGVDPGNSAALLDMMERRR
jgi:hypothetical protein